MNMVKINLQISQRISENNILTVALYVSLNAY